MNSVTVIDDGRRVRRLAHCDSHDEEAAAGDNNRRNRVDSSPHVPFSTMPLRSRDSYSGVRRSRSHCVVRWFTDVRLLGPGFNQLPGPCAWLLGRLYGRGIVRETTPMVVPITSPETTSSTRRFCWRPSAVSLDATGCVLPNPCDVMDAAGIFSLAR